MPRAISVRGGTRSDRPVDGPRPFSQEWLHQPVEQRQPPAHRTPPLPDWVPSERTLAAILVLILVLTTIAMNGGPALKTAALAPSPTKSADELAAMSPTDQVIVAPPSVTSTSTPSQPTQTPIDSPEIASSAAATESPVLVTDERALLPKFRIVSYYGQPADENMGILGQLEMPDLLDQLQDEAQAYEQADPSRPVMPAFEVIASVAQNWPADDDTYLLHTDAETIQKYVDFARANGLIIILDLQIGQSTIPDEIDRVRQWLVEPFVHLALDSEFAMADGQVPGQEYGSLDASDILVAQQALSEIVAENNLPPKLLIIHGFTESMVTNADKVAMVPGVQTVIDFDGYGDPASKIEGYDLLTQPEIAEYAGFKLFYEKDSTLMQPEEVLSLDRPPDVVIYQ
jgi:hypothetical protein